MYTYIYIYIVYVCTLACTVTCVSSCARTHTHTMATCLLTQCRRIRLPLYMLLRTGTDTGMYIGMLCRGMQRFV